jgi:hypothetical protein
LKYSSDYTKPWFQVQRYTDPMGLKFHIGEPVSCLICGNKVNHSSDCMLCGDCDEEYGSGESETYAICPTCGERTHRRDLVYVDVTHDYICRDCAEARYKQCDDCGAYFDPDSLVEMNDDLICHSCLRYRNNEWEVLPF